MTEVVLWQYRWTNPADQQDEWSLNKAKKWEAVEHPHWQPLEMRLLELREARFDGKPCYEVRALGVIPDGVACTADGDDARRYRHIRSALLSGGTEWTKLAAMLNIAPDTPVGVDDAVDATYGVAVGAPAVTEEALYASDMAAARMTEDEIHERDWWCPHCLKEVPPEMVTKDGEHYLEFGGCGRTVRGELKDAPGVAVPQTPKENDRA